MRLSKKNLLLLPLFLLAGGCASSGDLNNVRNDIDAVKFRLFSVEKDLGGVRNESKTGLGSMEKTFKSDVASVRQIAADIQASVDSTKTEAQLLNGKLDDFALAVKKPAEDLARYREDADRRILALEERIIKMDASIEELKKNLTDAMRQKQADVALQPDFLYMKGLDAFKKGDMPVARENFKAFIEQNPQHELAANAHYWIGETYYSEKAYEPAIVSFQDVIKNYPGKEKVPAAMLKQAISFRAINDLKSARFVLKRLAESYPRSEEAKKAKELQKELK